MDESNNNPIQGDNNQENNNPIQENNQNQENNNPIQENNQNNNTNVGESNSGQQYNNYAQNVNSANTKKKSKAPIIIIVVIIILLILGCLVSGVAFFGYKFYKDNIENKLDIENEVNNRVNEINKINNEVNSISNKITGANNTTTKNTVNNTTTTNNVVTGDAKTSTKEAPLSKGEWGIASKYSTETKDYEPVNVKVTKITRGEDAKKDVQDYINSSSIYKYEEPAAGLEWLVIDYDVDFTNFTMSSLGANADISGDIEGTESSSVKYNGTTYITSTRYIGSRDYVKTNTTSGKIATQIPIGCTDYIITFGAYGKTIAYFQGE